MSAVKSLKGSQKQHLRRLAHSLKPIVLVGDAGLTDAVIAATSQALEDHELIKVRFRRPEDKKGSALSLAESTGAHLCNLVGHTATLYRRHPEEPKIFLPKA